ncbi:hypothetical protein LZ32DRAFT_447737 [Colletotrichum eremochloae]|nr:hypothetical protein LZ32DRAFT_447737 [Colletotrichum eremochloae]
MSGLVGWTNPGPDCNPAALRLLANIACVHVRACSVTHQGCSSDTPLCMCCRCRRGRPSYVACCQPKDMYSATVPRYRYSVISPGLDAGLGYLQSSNARHHWDPVLQPYLSPSCLDSRVKLRVG